MEFNSTTGLFTDSSGGSLFHAVFSFAVGRSENSIPERHRHSEVRARNLMVNLVVGAEFPVPGAFRIIVMMDVVETIVEDESGQHARREAGNVACLQPVGEDIPDAYVDARVQEPGHPDQHLRVFMVHGVPGVQQCFPFMINPAVKTILQKRPARESR